MDDALHRAFREGELTGNGFVGDLVEILVSHGLPVLLTGAFFGRQAFNGFPKKVATLSASESLCLDDESPSGSLNIDEGGFWGVMVVER